MHRPFAIVQGLNKIFDVSTDVYGKQFYITDILKANVETNHPNVGEDTLFYIHTDNTDHNIGYNGTYIYSQHNLFSNYDNKGGQFIRQNLRNAALDDTTVFLIGTVTPLYEDTPWSINYHIQQYSNNTAFNSEFDVCIYGINGKVLHYYSQNANNTKIPYKYHIAKQNSNNVEIGLCIGDTEDNNTVNRNISLIITDYKYCKFTFNDSGTTSLSDDCVRIDANKNDKQISFTPTGTVSAPTFYGTEASISVSGQVDGTNSASEVTIVGSTVSVNSITSTGSLPSVTYDAETATFNAGTLPSYSSSTVWNGYSSATAAAQTFNGATVTLSGTYTPAGTVSAPTFTGDEITITV